MKKTLKSFLFVGIMIVICVCFISCGNTLSGIYRSPEALGSYTIYEFKGNKVKVETYRAATKIDSSSFEGKYEIKDDEIIFTYKDENGEKTRESKSFEKLDDESIKIGVIVYEKT
jgi:hypothetical protein